MAEPCEQNLHPTACHDVPTLHFGVPRCLRSLLLSPGASSGIGLSLAKKLASRGYDLVVCSSGERLPKAAKIIRPPVPR